MLNNPSVTVTLIIQIILSLILIVLVLFQNSNQEGLSGAIGGGNADSFYGKNKGRTLDSKLKKFTAIVAILFLISSVVLGIFVHKSQQPAESSVPYTLQDSTIPGGDPIINSTADGDVNPEVNPEVNPDAGQEPSTPDEPVVTDDQN